ncbi:MAG: hypothetical protein K2I43_09015 [Alistipes sp.]|nr:hypothetical protein [Alistipes sp.]
MRKCEGKVLRGGLELLFRGDGRLFTGRFHAGRISESIRRMRAFVPFSFVDRDRSAALHAYDSVRQKIWRIGEYDIELEVETVQKFDAVSVRQREAL